MALPEKHIKIHYDDRGYGYENVFGPYLVGAAQVTLEDPFIRQPHQLANLVRFCELLVRIGDCEKFTLITAADSPEQQQKNQLLVEQLGDSLQEQGIFMTINFSETLHDQKLY